MHWLECHQQYTLNQLTAPTLIDLKIIHEEVEQELRLKEIIQKLQGGEEVNNLLDATWHASVQGEDSNCQTSSLIPAILHTYHDSVFRGHSGFLRTYKRSTGQLYWEGMKSDIQKYCEECVVCQRNKSLALTPAGLLLPLEIPNKVWNDISMDFIEGLPKAAGYEVILVVVDCFSKYMSTFWLLNTCLMLRLGRSLCKRNSTTTWLPSVHRFW